MLSPLDFGLCLKDNNDNLDAGGHNRESQMKSASKGGFWSTH